MTQGDIAIWVKSGTLDAEIRPRIGPWKLPVLYDLDTLGLELLVEFGTVIDVMAFNLEDARYEVNPDSRNDIIEYRMAVLAAVDRQGLAETLEMGTVNSITGIAVDRYDNDAWVGYDDTSPVGDLLAGVEEPREAVYTSSHGERTMEIGTAVSEQLAIGGIDTTTDFDGDFFFARVPERLVDLYSFRMFVGEGGLSSVVQALEVFDPDSEIAFWSPLTEEADRYRKLLAEAESILADNAVIYPLVRRNTHNIVYWPERIQGLVPNRFHGWDTWNAAMWWSPGG